jgi:hypothetical protein
MHYFLKPRKLTRKSTLDHNEMATTTSVTLPIADESPCSGSISLSPVEVSTCQLKNEKKKFKDIAYLSKSNAFYLLTETAVDYLTEAEDVFKSRLSGDHDALMQGLSKAKILDGLLSADVSSFMSDSDRADYLEAKIWLEDHAQPRYLGYLPVRSATEDYELRTNKATVKRCIASGIGAAKEQGYTYDKGLLYSEREIKTKKCVDKYIKARESFSKDSSHTPMEQITELENQLKALRELFGTKLSDGSYEILYIAEYQHKHLNDKLDKSKKNYNELCQTIEDLAKVGIATPELALAGGQPTAEGHSLLAEYHSYLAQAGKFKEALNDRIKEVVDATNGYAIPPTAAFEREYSQLEALEQKALSLYALAVETIAAMPNPLRLIWDLNYQPKPIQKLIKGDFPLREILLATEKGGSGEFGELRYVSLNDIPRPTGAAIANYATNAESDVAFAKLLGVEALRVDISEHWFDEKGLFVPALFYQYLEHQNITVDSLTAKPQTWENAIEKMLYSKILAERLDPFDCSWQSQFFRMSQTFTTAEPKATLSYKTTKENGESKTVRTPSTGLTTLAEVEAKLDIISARGEVNLIEISTGSPYLYFPREVNVSETVTLKYEHDGREEEVKFACGAIQSRIYCKAWGFAGASFVLGGKVELGAKGLELPTVYEQEKEDPSAATLKFIDLKAEANIGIELGSYLDWYVPDSLPDFIRPNAASKLTLVKGAVKAQAGATLDFPIRFFMKNDKLNIGLSIGPPSTKVVLEGEIQPEALGAWVWQFQQILRKCRYHKIDIADDETFKKLTLLSQSMLYAQINLGLFLAQGKDRLDRIIDCFEGSKAAVVAYTIVFGNSEVLETWIKGMIPEALGPLLWTLTQEPVKTKALDNNGNEIDFAVNHSFALQKIALALIFDWIDKLPINSGLTLSQRQVEEALVRMNATGDAGKEQFEKDYDFKQNLNTTRRFINNDIQLEEADSNSLNDINNRLKIEEFNNYKKIDHLDKNIKILTENKEIEIDGMWGDVLKSMVEKIGSNRYY